MIFQRIIWLVFVLVGLISLTGKSQISQGGEPMKTGLLKSSRKPVVEMPALNKFMLAENESDDQLRENEIKTFSFCLSVRSEFYT
jgi:hypothetical protein